MTKIIKYENEKEVLAELIEELQNYLVEIDPLERLLCLPESGVVYSEDLLDKVTKNNGIVYLAEIDGKIVGMIAGVLEERTKVDDVSCIPSKSARILDLIVKAEYRGQNIGSLLMIEAEKYFKELGCDIIRVEVFEPNHKTHIFYEKHGYGDRAIDMVKVV
jgi:ribosomal protein S18 acetylase RimI-like enzyme